MGKHAELAGVIGQRETSAIAAVVDEITVKPAEQYFLSLLPPTPRPEFYIYHEKVTGFGGLLKERNFSEEGVSGAASSSEVIEFSPGAYQESVIFQERELLTLRALGDMGKRGATGLTSGALDFLSRAGMGLQVKLNNRLNKLAADALFTGKYTFKGNTKIDFLVPTANTVQSTTDWSVPATATPFTDLFKIILTNAVFYKYMVKEIVINPVTAAAMLTSVQAQDVIKNNSAAVGDINKIREILYPGLPEIRIVKDAYQDQTIVGGKVVNGSAQYFQPDYYVLVVPEFGGSLYGSYGELSLTYNINDPSASINSPAVGVYTLLDDVGLARKKNPSAEVITGFNGGPNLMRSNDVLIVKAKVGV
jgi:hypothetical protein